MYIDHTCLHARMYVLNILTVTSPTIGEVVESSIYDLDQVWLRQTPQVRPDRGSNSSPPDHDSTFHVTKTPALTFSPDSDYEP